MQVNDDVSLLTGLHNLQMYEKGKSYELLGGTRERQTCESMYLNRIVISVFCACTDKAFVTLSLYRNLMLEKA